MGGEASTRIREPQFNSGYLVVVMQGEHLVFRGECAKEEDARKLAMGQAKFGATTTVRCLKNDRIVMTVGKEET